MATQVTMVRLYLTEGDKLLKSIMEYLHDEVKVQGVTVLRAMTGFGSTGVMHSADLLTMSLDLPLVVEFFDKPAIVDRAISVLENMLTKKHIVSWPAMAH